MFERYRRVKKEVCSDEWLTPEFLELEKKIPWLNKSGRSVGCTFEGNERGSAVLLDSNGTVALTEHQVEGKSNLNVIFRTDFEEPDIAVKGFTKVIPIQLTHSNKVVDIAFGHISTDLVKMYNLVPVTWAQKTPIKAGIKTMIMGFPANDELPVLTARRGKGIYHINASEGDNDIQSLVALGDAEPGMSGGGLFKTKTGSLVGLTKLGKVQVTVGWSRKLHMAAGFLPVDAIWTPYKAFYPENAKTAVFEKGEPIALSDKFGLYRASFTDLRS